MIRLPTGGDNCVEPKAGVDSRRLPAPGSQQSRCCCPGQTQALGIGAAIAALKFEVCAGRTRPNSDHRHPFNTVVNIAMVDGNCPMSYQGLALSRVADACEVDSISSVRLATTLN